MLFQARYVKVPAFASVATIGNLGTPRYWATVWASFLPSDLAISTLIKKLRCVDELYDYTDQNWGADRLDHALLDFDLPGLCDMLEGYFLSIQDSVNLNAASDERWQAGLQFVMDTCRRISRHQKVPDRIADLQARLSRHKQQHASS